MPELKSCCSYTTDYLPQLYIAGQRFATAKIQLTIQSIIQKNS